MSSPATSASRAGRLANHQPFSEEEPELERQAGTGGGELGHLPADPQGGGEAGQLELPDAVRLLAQAQGRARRIRLRGEGQ